MVDEGEREGRFEQLKRLILLRLILTFGLLPLTKRGSTLITSDWQGIDDRALASFIIVLFFLSLIYIFWLRSRAHLEFLTRLQCALDPLLVTVLVLLTGGPVSPLIFLFALSVLTTALLLGRRDAIMVAGMVWLLSFVILPLTAIIYQTQVDVGPEVFRRMVFQGVAYFLTALLGGTLAEKAMGLESAVAAQQDSLANLAALNRQIIQAMPYGLLTVNNQGIVRTISQESLEYLPKSSLHPAGRLLSQVCLELDWVVEKAGLDACYVEVPLQGRILGVNVSALRDHQSDVIGHLVVLNDLTTQKRLEKELAQREKLALSGRMAAYMAHEIRNPLASILQAAQMFGTPGFDGQQDRLKGIIMEEIKRLKALTTDFLLFSRPSQAVPEIVLLYPFLVEMSRKLVHDPAWGGESRVLSLEMPEDLRVRADSNHLWQIFWNLLLNAAQFSPIHERVRVKGAVRGGRVEVEILDKGSGMDPDSLIRALEPFYTTRNNGTGLGLAVVDQLIRQNRGSLRYGNRSDGGLWVRLTMDVAH